MKYLLDLDELVPGDIILEAGANKFSGAIKAATGSDYSHAMLYVGNTIIHALTDGVYSLNPQRLLVENVSDLKVLRYNLGLSSENINHVTTHARNLTGSLYSKSEAGATTLLNTGKMSAMTTNQFCSRLVAQSYLQIGISIVKNPDYCSPGDIERSQCLVEIKGCLRQATKQDIEMASKFDPIIENQRVTFEWLNKARNTFKSKNIVIQTINDVSQGLLQFPELDSEISGHIEASGYLSHYSIDKSLNSYRYDGKQFKNKILEVGNPYEVLGVELNAIPNEISRHGRSYLGSKQNYLYRGLMFHKHHMDLYESLLGICRERLVIISENSKLFGLSTLEVSSRNLISDIDNIFH